MTVSKNIKQIAWKSLQTVYSMKMVKDKGTYNTVYKRYSIIGGSIGEIMALLLDYHPESFDYSHFSQ